VNFARVIGTVWATVKDPHVRGIALRIIRPEDESGRAIGAPLVAADKVSAREGDRVFFVRAREAAKAFPGKFAPVDAAILGIVDGAEATIGEGPRS
jgi:ethanolamine utilization protein EutN